MALFRDSIEEGPSPLELVNEAQTKALDLSHILKPIVYGILLLSIYPLVVCLHQVIVTEQSAKTRAIAFCATYAVLFFSMMFMLWRAKSKVATIRLILADLYVIHQEKKHQTCGSMDPTETKAR